MRLVYVLATALWFWLILSVAEVMTHNMVKGVVYSSWNFFSMMF